jgi:hypothetical protein
MTAASEGRWTCPQCGANNFETVTACWKCGAGRVGVSPQAMAAGRGVERPMAPQPAPAYALPAPVGGDAGTARRAALLLAFTLPFIGLPVGWIFMMMEDYRRQAIGRFCVLWSCIALLAHLFLGIFALQALTAVATRFLLPMVQQMQQQGGGSRNELPSALDSLRGR